MSLNSVKLNHREKSAGTLCLTFDNMGRAREIGEGRIGRPDALEPGLAIGYPRLLALLEDIGVRGTFFIEGWNGLHHPEREQELVARGHEVGLHGWVHEKFATLDQTRAEQVLYDGTAALARLGIRAAGFRAPGGLAAGGTQAQAWPAKPVRIIVAFAPGGSLDFVTRAVSERLSQELGQSFVVENRAGANGNIGAEYVAKAAGRWLRRARFRRRAAFERAPVQASLRPGGQAITHLIGGQVQIGSLGSTPVMPHYKAGKLKIIAQSTATRAPSLPEVPTYQESGVPIVLDQWLGFLFPAGTSAEVVSRLNAAVAKVLAQPEMHEHFALQALEVAGGSAEQFAKRYRDDYENYGRS